MDRRISLLIGTRGDQSGPEGPAIVMAEIVDGEDQGDQSGPEDRRL